MTQQAIPAQRAFPSRFRPCAPGAAVTVALSLLCGPAGAQALAGAAAAILVAPGLALPELARTAPAAGGAEKGKGADGIDAATFRQDGPRAAGRDGASATVAPAAADAPAQAPRHTGRERA